MKNVALNLGSTMTIARFAEAFEVYQREYNRKSESEIQEEKAKFNHCLGLTKKVCIARADESQTEEPDED